MEISDYIIHATALRSSFKLKKNSFIQIIWFPKSFLVDKLNWKKAMRVFSEHWCRQCPVVAKHSSTKKAQAFVLLRLRPKRKKKEPGREERTDQEVRRERLQRRKLGKKGTCRWNSEEQLRGLASCQLSWSRAIQELRDEINVKDFAKSSTPFASSTSSKMLSTNCSPASLISLHSALSHNSPATLSKSQVNVLPECPAVVTCLPPSLLLLCPVSFLRLIFQTGNPFCAGRVHSTSLVLWVISYVTAICGFLLVCLPH